MHQPLRSVFDLLLQRRRLLFLALAPLCAVLLMFALLSGPAAVASPAETQMHAPLASGPGVVVYTKPMPDDPDSNIWIMNIDGSNQTQLTTYTGQDMWPAISPDGAKIAYGSIQNGEQQLWVMNVDGTDKLQLPVSGHTQRTDWSSDGSKLALTHDDLEGNWWEIWVVNHDGSDLHRLTTQAAPTGSPSWSPDGQKLVYAVEEPSPQYNNIYVINSDGTGETLLVSATTTGYSNHMPAWSPDGAQIATVRHPAGNASNSPALWLMDADGSNGHILVSDIEVPNHNRINWTADSNWLLFTKSGNIWRVARDGTQLSQITFNGGWEPSIGPGRLGSSCSPTLSAADIMLLVDRSGSMAEGTKLVDAKAAISDFLVNVDAPPDQIGLASFATTATLDQPLTTNKAIVDSAAQALSATGTTYINLGLEAARLELGSSRHVITHTKVIILLSDGGQWDGDAAAVLAQADAAKLEGATIYAIGLGANVDAVLLQQIATSVDHYYFAPSGSDLHNIYDQISADLACPNIGGEAFVDQNKDGQYTLGVDTPLAGVTVRLSGAVVSQTVSISATPVNYLFPLNPAGTYTVSVDLTTIPEYHQATTPTVYTFTLGVDDDVDNHFGFKNVPPPNAIIAYTRSDPDTPSSNIWGMNINGGNQTQLTTYADYDRFPAFSPDGTKIAYTSYHNNQSQVWVMNSNGTGKVQLPVSGDTQRLTWSPNGTKLALTRDGGDGHWWEVWLVNANGSNPQRISDHGGATGSPTWSPSGQKLVYVVEEPSPQYYALYVVNSNGTGATPLVPASEYSNHYPAWSPDGTQIATIRFASGNLNGSADLWLMDANGANGRVLVPNVETPYNHIAWSGDSEWLFFGKADNVWRVRRNGTQLTQLTTNGGWEPTLSAKPTGLPPLKYVFLPVLTNNFCLDFFDNFSNPSSGWPVGEDAYVRYEYLNDEYRVLTKEGGYVYLFRSPSCSRVNYTVEVDAHWSGATGVSYGIVFGVEGAFSRYYMFDISPDFQEFGLIRRDAGGFNFIVPFTPSTAIRTNSSNHLKVTRNGSAITLEVNGTLLGTWNDASIGGATGAGVYSIPYSNPPTSDARFDNFSMKTLLGGAAASSGSSAIQDRQGELPSIYHEGLTDTLRR